MNFSNIPKSICFFLVSISSAMFSWVYWNIIKGFVESSKDPRLSLLDIPWEVYIEFLNFTTATGIFLALFFAYGTIVTGIKEYNEYRKKIREETIIEEGD